jgi:hypothetical protein
VSTPAVKAEWLPPPWHAIATRLVSRSLHERQSTVKEGDAAQVLGFPRSPTLGTWVNEGHAVAMAPKRFTGNAGLDVLAYAVRVYV